jgi:beta-galactosidase/beta-glucuronidase
VPALRLDKQLRLAPARPERDAAKLLEADRIEGQPDRNVVASGNVVVRQRGATIRADRVEYSATDQVAVAAAVNEPKLWSPGAPNLYDLAIELKSDGQVVDRVSSYFGFRSVTIRQNRVALNGDPIFLKMVLDQGYWPESALTPPSDEAIRFDIQMTKDMGFNGARKHQKLEDPRYLYWADKMGLLVSDEMANAFRFDHVYAGRFTREWVETVERDVNHPSVIIWAPLNESWGTPNVSDPRQQAHLKANYQLTRALDDSRLVIDNEGWEHTDQTDLFALHDYARTGDLLYEKYKDIGKPGAVVPDNGAPALAPGYRYNGTPFYLSEFGGIAFIPAGQKVPQQAWGYAGVEKTPEAALERLRGLYKAIGRIPAFAGICYTQLTDVEQEVNGLMTYDRKMKFDAKTLREINGIIE